MLNASLSKKMTREDEWYAINYVADKKCFCCQSTILVELRIGNECTISLLIINTDYYLNFTAIVLFIYRKRIAFAYVCLGGGSDGPTS